ncbi:hypothetical protein ACQP00_19655 [Dactylosporangium sp. CS-047395]|uniref:hypothetical protein n=1 Tax=Dactylosporangium sp. CS-047395 TaxID=3239936 RepID=UPI003D8CA017
MTYDADENGSKQARRLLRLRENDYRFGAGALILRVEHVSVDAPMIDEGEPWYRVRGIEITGSGHSRGPREAWVRARSLPQGLRPDDANGFAGPS